MRPVREADALLVNVAQQAHAAREPLAKQLLEWAPVWPRAQVRAPAQGRPLLQLLAERHVLVPVDGRREDRQPLRVPFTEPVRPFSA